MIKYLFAALSIISISLDAAMPPSKPPRIMDHYIPMLEFLDAFIAGGNGISSPTDTVIQFRSLSPSDPPHKLSAKQAVDWLEKAYKQTESLHIECDLYKKVLLRHRLFGQSISDAAQQTLATLSYEEKLTIQLQRTQILKLLFLEDDKILSTEVEKEIEKLKQRALSNFVAPSSHQNDQSWFHSTMPRYVKEQEMLSILPEFVCSRFRLLLALQKGNHTDINIASQEAYVSPDFFPPLKEFLEKEQPKLIKIYKERAAREKS